MIAQGKDVRAPLRERVHTLVVGTGSGGGPVAAILAEAGVDVLVLEEGGRYEARDFTQRDDEMYPRLYRDGGNQRTADGLITVLQGSCYGGSTVINTSDCTPIPPPVYAHWKRLVGLAELDETTLADAQAHVFESIHVSPIEPAQVNRNNALVLEGAARLGLQAGTFLHNRVGCQSSGYCLIGCAYDAKQGSHLTWLPRAIAAGARVQVDARVERIEIAGERRFVVHGAIVERTTRDARLPLRIECQRVVLAAGAVHSPAILHASGLGRSHSQLGRNVSLQPQMLVMADFPDPVRAWRGIPQASFVSSYDDDTPEHGLGGFRLEGISGGTSQIGMGIPGFGLAHKERMARLPHLASGLVLVPDRPVGHMSFEWDARRGCRVRIDYALTEEWITRLRRGMKHAAELYFAIGAQEVAFGSETLSPLRSPDELPSLDAFLPRSGDARLISAHVQGSCRMSPDVRTGVVDSSHQVHDVPGLYVVDASVMPTTASTHTMIPVMTLAVRAAWRIAEQRG